MQVRVAVIKVLLGGKAGRLMTPPKGLSSLTSVTRKLFASGSTCTNSYLFRKSLENTQKVNAKLFLFYLARGEVQKRERNDKVFRSNKKDTLL